MAVEPLYFNTLTDLLTTVRIDKADDDGTEAAVMQAVRDVRLGFFSSLGKTRALEIAGYQLVDNPSSDSEVLIAQAAGAEAIWLTLLLIQRLPVLFMDDASSVGGHFNDEPVTRDGTSIREFKGDLQEQLNDLLGKLADDSSAVDSLVKSSLNGPATPYLLADNAIGGWCSNAY